MINPAITLTHRVLCDELTIYLSNGGDLEEPARHHMGLLQTISVRLQYPVYFDHDEIEEGCVVPCGLSTVSEHSTVYEAIYEMVERVFGRPVAEALPSIRQLTDRLDGSNARRLPDREYLMKRTTHTRPDGHLQTVNRSEDGGFTHSGRPLIIAEASTRARYIAHQLGGSTETVAQYDKRLASNRQATVDKDKQRAMNSKRKWFD